MIFLETYLNVLLPFTQYGLPFMRCISLGTTELKQDSVFKTTSHKKNINYMATVFHKSQCCLSHIFLFCYHLELSHSFIFGVIFKIKTVMKRRYWSVIIISEPREGWGTNIRGCTATPMRLKRLQKWRFYESRIPNDFKTLYLKYA